MGGPPSFSASSSILPSMTPPWEPVKLLGGRNALSIMVFVRFRGGKRSCDKYFCLEEWFLMNDLEDGLNCKELLSTQESGIFMALRRSLILARNNSE
jgi:hypothetical protein